MRNNLARLREVFEEQAETVIAQPKPEYIIQQQTPRYRNETERQIAILQQQMC